MTKRMGRPAIVAIMMVLSIMLLFTACNSASSDLANKMLSDKYFSAHRASTQKIHLTMNSDNTFQLYYKSASSEHATTTYNGEWIQTGTCTYFYEVFQGGSTVVWTKKYDCQITFLSLIAFLMKKNCRDIWLMSIPKQQNQHTFIL